MIDLWLFKFLLYTLQVQISTDTHRTVSAFSVHQYHAAYFSKKITYYKTTKHYRIEILFTVWYC